MNTPTGVASATSEISHLQPMASIIDSLKRLERVGSEHSETTRKLIEAAKALSEKIVSLYPAEDGDALIVSSAAPDGTVDAKRQKMRYCLKQRTYDHAVWNCKREAFVFEDRETALQFAGDLANGLLEYIEEDLQKRIAADKDGLSAIEAAAAAFQKKATDQPF